MKSLTRADFLRWAEDHGLTLDYRYPQLAIFQFRPASDSARFWCVPNQSRRRPRFFASVLEFASPWDACFVWRHRGSWPNKEHLDTGRVNDGVEFELLKGIGVPCGTAR